MSAQMTPQSLHKKSTEVRRDSAVRSFFDRFAAALTHGDGLLIATIWDVPALVLGEGMSHAIGSRDEGEAFYAEVKRRHDARGVTSVSAELVQLDWPADGTAVARVRWTLKDKIDREIGVAKTTYVLCRDQVGTLKIRVVVMEGEEDSIPYRHTG